MTTEDQSIKKNNVWPRNSNKDVKMLAVDIYLGREVRKKEELSRSSRLLHTVVKQQ